MGEEFDDIVAMTVKTQEQSKEAVERLFAVAQPSATTTTSSPDRVYQQPAIVQPLRNFLPPSLSISCTDVMVPLML